MTKISIVLGSYNRRHFLEAAIRSVRDSLRFSGVEGEIIVVDGGSTDGSMEYLIRQKDVLTLVQHNRGEWEGRTIQRRSWGYFMNLAFRAAQGKYVLMVSDDCLLQLNSIRVGVAEFERLSSSGKRVGAVPFYWRNWPEMDHYWVGYLFGHVFNVNHGLYSKEALEKVGYADEETFSFYCADGDLCLRIQQAGYEIVPCESAFVEHYSDANLDVRSTNESKVQKDQVAYFTRWEGKFPGDSTRGGWVHGAKADPDQERFVEQSWKRAVRLEKRRNFRLKILKKLGKGLLGK